MSERGPEVTGPGDRGVMIVTGGSRGIGAATARLAGRAGYHVVVNYASSLDAAERVVAEITGAGGRAVALKADIGSEAEIAALFEAADRLGPLAVLVNNAGIVEPAARLEAMSAARIERIVRVNLVGAMLCAREAVRRLSTRNGGRGGAIVNVSSAAAKLGAPGWYIEYAAAKGGIDSFTVGLAREVAEEGIRVTAVRPGIIDTEIHASMGEPDRAAQLAPLLPMKRPGSAEEVARAILWLASEEASYSAGAILDVSGARSVAP